MKLKTLILPLFLWAALALVLVSLPGCASFRSAKTDATTATHTINDTADDIDQRVNKSQNALGSASNKVDSASNVPGVPKASKDAMSDAKTDINTARITLTPIPKQDTPAIRAANAKAHAATVKFETFYDKWNHAWFGPRLWACVKTLIFTLVGFGVLMALAGVLSEFSPFAFLVPVVSFVENLLGPIFTHVFTVGIPALVTGVVAVGTWLWTKGNALWSSFRTSKTPASTTSTPSTAVPAATPTTK
jgi:hypothetical protein